MATDQRRIPRRKRPCKWCGRPSSLNALRGICRACWLLKLHDSNRRKRESGKIIAFQPPPESEANFKFYGVADACRECSRKCRQYAAPHSQIVYCPRMAEEYHAEPMAAQPR